MLPNPNPSKKQSQGSSSSSMIPSNTLMFISGQWKYLEMYRQLQEFRKYWIQEEIIIAFNIFFSLVSRIYHSKDDKITITQEEYDALEDIGYGDLHLKFREYTELPEFEAPCPICLWNMRIVFSTYMHNERINFIQGSGGTPIYHETWNVIWVFLKRQANSIITPLEARILKAIGDKMAYED